MGEFPTISPGDDPLSLLTSARWLNAVSAVAGGGGIAGGPPGPIAGDGGRLPVVCKIKNNSGVDVPRYGLLGVDAPLIDKTANEKYFLGPVLQFKGVKPKAQHAGRLAVALGPIAQDKIGDAVIPCAVQTKVDVITTTDRFASIIDDDVGKLRSGLGGTFHMIPGEAGVGVKWAVVFLGRAVDDELLKVLITSGVPAAAYAAGALTPTTFTARVWVKNASGQWTHSAANTKTCTNPYRTAIAVAAGQGRLAWVKPNGELIVADCTAFTL
ncbi:MAG: hypothetical protein H0T51_07920 [Pirellulales bacterium]|nr:hypothetical protein [Pirellulales bacterium]